MTDPTPAYEDAYDWRKPDNKSSQIDAFAWDENPDHPIPGRMMVRFKSYRPSPMAVYAYPNATEADMTRLATATCTGAAFNVWKLGESAKGYIRLPDEPQPEPDPGAEVRDLDPTD